MKTLFVIWMLITFVLAISIIGWVLIIPKQNYTDYDKSVDETRSTWMRIGYGMFNRIMQQ